MRMDCEGNDKFELHKVFKEANVLKSIKLSQLRYACDICRIDPSSSTFRICNYKPIGTRGRPKLRWTDCVEDAFKVLKVTNRKTAPKRRLEWKGVF
ncbi:hypothetical protein TNCV_1571971 [Trichonephila clavipes]|uniref:Uncharacterized protein n=1 Tax=Trichonephila clavipes TaxID=2585209 RepID=A0A8X6SL09_TRICX|nr:hypothetical protein TNCV_1571971 [Trichonephila clavipes]